MKLSQFKNTKGLPVKNQFLIIEYGRGSNGNFIKRETFQSYNSVIAIKTYWREEDIKEIPNAKALEIELDSNFWDYSTTTGKYRNQFLNETKAETEKKIKQGVYKLSDLNKGE
jgi:hypothetical protein